MLGVIYFPYINLNNTPWLRQTLLYYDSVSSIVPFEFWQEPSRLAEDMRVLVREGIVGQVSPLEIVHRVPDFGERFKQHLDVNPRRSIAPTDQWQPVHVEKLGDLLENLQERGLAKRPERGRADHSQWLLLEPRTAKEFMAFLAATIAALPSGSSRRIAMTDSESHFDLYFSGNYVQSQMHTRVLNEILPSPRENVDLRRLIEFKKRYSKELIKLRKEVDRCIRKATFLPAEHQCAAMDLSIEELKERSKQVSEKMRQSGMASIGYGSFAALAVSGIAMYEAHGGSTVSRIGSGLGLISAVASVSKDLRGGFQEEPIAYASRAWNSFG